MARRNRRPPARRDDSVRPSGQRVQISVTLTPGQVVWLLTGIAIGKLPLLDLGELLGAFVSR